MWKKLEARKVFMINFNGHHDDIAHDLIEHKLTLVVV